MSAIALRLPLQDDTIVLRGDLDFFHKDALLAQLASATTWGRVTIDLGEVRFLDASALSCFVHLYKAMRSVRPNPVIRLLSLRPHVAALFRLTHLDSLFELIESDATSTQGIARIRTGRSSETQRATFATTQ
jgi:anti-anti-sigma factor